MPETAKFTVIKPNIDNYTIISTLWRAIEANLLTGWVFGGVMRNAGAEFMPKDAENLWVAVAVKEGNVSLGPVPSLEGSGTTAAGAMGSLMVALADFREAHKDDQEC